MDITSLNIQPHFITGTEPGMPIVDRDIPFSGANKFETVPYKPRQLNIDYKFLGTKFTTYLSYQVHSDLIGAISKPGKLDASRYAWRQVILYPKNVKAAVYGDTGQISTWSERWHQAFSQGYNTGIKMPRGFGENLSKYQKLWDIQVQHSFDAFNRQAQVGIYREMYSNLDPLKEHLKLSGITLDMTVTEYLEKFENPFVNIFREVNGFYRYGVLSEKLLDIYYKDRAKNASWVHIVTPEIDSLIRFDKPENVFFLYAGFGKMNHPNEMTIWEYSKTEKLYGNVVYVQKNFPINLHDLGTNIATRNVEFPRYYRFIPFGMKLDKPFDPNEYYIEITDENGHSDYDKKIYYRNVLLSLLHDYEKLLLAAFGLKKTQNFGELVEKCIISVDKLEGSQKCIKEITMGSVKNPDNYYEYFKKASGLKKALDDLENLDIENIIQKTPTPRQTNGYEKVITQYNQWENFYRLAKKIAKIFVDSGIKIGNYSGDVLKNFIIYSLGDEPLKKILEKLAPNWTNNWQTVVQQFKELVVLKKVPTTGQTLKELFQAIKLEKIKELVEGLLELKVDVPWGIHIHRRPTILSTSTPRVEKNSITHLSTEVMVSGAENYPDGSHHFTLYIKYADMIEDSRTVQINKNTFPIKTIYGGGDKIWKNPKNGKFTHKNAHKFGDIFIVPVTKNEVLGDRIEMIDETGFDSDPSSWKDTIKKIKLENEDEKDCYYSTYKAVRSYYKWMNSNFINYASDHNFNKKLPVRIARAWAGYQKHSYNNTTEAAIGPFAKNPRWWNVKKPVVKIEK